MSVDLEKPEKVRRTKKQIIEAKLQELLNCQPKVDVPIKKRGRKPKGGKIIKIESEVSEGPPQKSHVILHLKCSLKDLETENDELNNIESFNFSASNFQNLKDDELTLPALVEPINGSQEDDDTKKNLWKKLKQLETDLHHSQITNSKSDCFWCTCSFDNPSIFIPKSYKNGIFDVYGWFCSPECSTSFLMNEKIDSSTKFERYQLLNYLYAKVFDYKNNIKPAPNPHYTLCKYFGNLSIQEYRAMLNTDRLYLILDKPLTRSLPELHEDNDDFIINKKSIPSHVSNYKLKIKKDIHSKKDIINDQFKSR
jgi:hypothetical protein